MNKYNICVVQPENYIHSNAIFEVAELLKFSLCEIGHSANICYNLIIVDCINIVFCCHLLSIESIKTLPESTIFFNSEQISSGHESWNNNIHQIAHAGFEFWDYSEKNILKFRELGFNNVKLFNIGYQKELNRLSHKQDKDIDVLFYGSTNDRRNKILQQLVDAGLNVKILFGVYGAERDEWIVRSKLVLNLHYYNSEIFEIIRAFYLISNGVTVVGEVNESTSIDPMFKAAIAHAPYEELANICIKLVKDDELRIKIGLDGLALIAQYTQARFTQSVLD
jgi:hypothetical protein